MTGRTAIPFLQPTFIPLPGRWYEGRAGAALTRQAPGPGDRTPLADAAGSWGCGG